MRGVALLVNRTSYRSLHDEATRIPGPGHRLEAQPGRAARVVPPAALSAHGAARRPGGRRRPAGRSHPAATAPPSAATPKGNPSSLTLLPPRPASSGKSVAPFGRHLAFGAGPATQMSHHLAGARPGGRPLRARRPPSGRPGPEDPGVAGGRCSVPAIEAEPGRHPVLRQGRARPSVPRDHVLVRRRPPRLRPGRPDAAVADVVLHRPPRPVGGRPSRSPSPPSATRAAPTTRSPTTA